jgi:NADH-quinone oxidoreductase subunit K
MVDPELALLHNYLVVGAMLFGIGTIGFLSRRNMIVMFISAEMMLQGVAVSLVAWGRYHNDFGGQMLVIFMFAIGACEAAMALALALTLFGETGKLDMTSWRELRESGEAVFADPEPEPIEELPPAQQLWPKLPPAGVRPEVPPEELDYRTHV